MICKSRLQMNLDKTKTMMSTKDLDLNLNLEQVEIGRNIKIHEIKIANFVEYIY